MKILLSAYSCEPHRGSEPGIGWNTAVELARQHDVWVVTKQRHRGPIERELAQRPQDRIRFVYYEVPFPLRWTNREGPLAQLHYYLWQYGVYPMARRLCREVAFDVAYHVTFGRFWSPSLFALLPVPFVWGAVGGGEVVPPAMRTCLTLRARSVERLKAMAFALYGLDPFVRLTARRSALILPNNPRSAERVARLATRRMELLETAVVDRETAALIDGLGEARPRGEGAPACFATLTRLLPWKGVHLGLQAFRRLGNPDARYWVVGEGPERGPLEKLAGRLGIASQVVFREGLSRADWMRVLKECHAMVHPALANSFNTVVLESMLCGTPVICLKTDYLVDKLGADTSYFVDWPNPEAAVEGLAAAMRQVAERPDEARQRGALARERARRMFTWDARIERLNRLLQEAASTVRGPAGPENH